MIYTKTGDTGTTSLVGGTRVSKDDVRVEAYGTVDELNSHLGLIAEMLRSASESDADGVKTIQRELFTIQTLLATEDADLLQRLPQFGADAVASLERWIDQTQSILPPLRSFVVPGGSLLGAQAHVARCVCRRAERRVVTLSREHQSPYIDQCRTYLNRLSDLLFVLSRKWTLKDGEEVCISVG